VGKRVCYITGLGINSWAEYTFRDFAAIGIQREAGPSAFRWWRF